jgi:hypothetical protein
MLKMLMMLYQPVDVDVDVVFILTNVDVSDSSSML